MKVSINIVVGSNLFNRYVNILEPKSDQDKPVSHFSSFIENHNIVLLGDPGAGKTHLFKDFSAHENAKYYEAATFLIYAGVEDAGKIIYIDGLDEERSATTNLIQDIIKKLLIIKPSKIRISCRSADWLGDTDFTLFKPLFENIGNTSVLNLDFLHENELDEILSNVYQGDIVEFKRKVNENDIKTLLLNPQTLLMLINVIKTDVWPTSKTELYVKSAQILLNEHNPKHQSNHIYSIDKLVDVAGKLSAHLLISNSIALNTHQFDINERINFIGDIPNQDTIITEIVLKSKLFTKLGENTFNYSHRTVAEFLTAKWLLTKIHKGLSLTRILESLGFSGYPTSEMKGIFAWLATLSNKFAPELISKDPFAVLTYGDPSQLAPQNKLILLEALDKLSIEEPWFYNHRKKSEALGVLSRESTKTKLVDLLTDKTSSLNLKLLIINIIEFGDWYDDYLSVLLNIIKDSNSAYVLRYDSFYTLVTKCSTACEQIVDIYNSSLKTDKSSLVLRSKILIELYQQHFTVDNVIELLKDYNENSESRVIGELWNFGKALPARELPEIFERSTALLKQLDSQGLRAVNRAVTKVYIDIAERVIPDNHLPIADTYNCLSIIHSFKSPYCYQSDNHEKLLQVWLKSNPDKLIELFNYGLKNLEDKSVYSFWHKFEPACLYTIDKGYFSQKIYQLCSDNVYQNDELKNALQICVMLSVQLEDIELYEALLNTAEINSLWKEAIQYWTYDELAQWRIDQIKDQQEFEAEEKAQLIKTRTEFEKDTSKVELGEHEGWLYHSASIYFGHYHDSDNALSPLERIVKELGEANYNKVLLGFNQYFIDVNIDISDVITSYRINKGYQGGWYVYMAAADIKWLNEGINSFTKEEKEKVILFDTVCHSPQIYGDQTENWVDQIIEENPQKATDIYTNLAIEELKQKCQNTTGISKLVYSQLIPEKIKTKPLIRLISSYPNMYLQDLKNIFKLLVTEESIYPDIATLAENTLNQRNKVMRDNRSYWLALLYITRPDLAYKKVTTYFKRNENIIWSFASLLGKREEKSKLPNSLSYKQLIELFGNKYLNAYHPRGTSSGSYNSWDAAEFIRGLLSKLSTFTGDEATKQLESLSQNKKLDSYKAHLKDALSSQRKLARNEKYRQLNWMETVNLLDIGKPSDSKSLLQFTMEALSDIQRSIKFSNTDIFKAFWNENPHCKVTTPKNEESCRDRLLDLIRLQTTSIGINAEPEGHMSKDKRADIVLFNEAEIILPLELKCETHPKLWDAQTKQLQMLYSVDPRANGYGIYVVFWFGERAKKTWRNPLNRGEVITNPQELQLILDELSPDEKIKAYVLDVSEN